MSSAAMKNAPRGKRSKLAMAAALAGKSVTDVQAKEPPFVGIIEGRRIDRPCTASDIYAVTNALERKGAIATAALLRTMWDEILLCRTLVAANLKAEDARIQKEHAA